MLRSPFVLALTLSAALGSTLPALAVPGGVSIFAAPKSAAAKKNIAVGKITGPNATKVRPLVFQQLKDAGYEVTDAEDLKPGSSKATIAKQAKVLQVDAVVMGTVSKKSDLTLSIYGADGKRVEEVKIKGGSVQKLKAGLASEYDALLAAPLAEASGAPLQAKAAPPPADVEEEEEEPEVSGEQPAAEEEPPAEGEPAAEASEEPEKEAADDDAKKAGLAPFELMVGMRGINREFDYTDNQGQRDPNASPKRALVPYSLGFGGAIVASTRLYPAAFFRDDAWSHIGLMADFELGIATTTKVTNANPPQELKTSIEAWSLGLRGRVPLGPAELGVFANYGAHSFILNGDEGGAGLQPLVPDVRYTYIRPGLDGRVHISKFLIGAHVAPRFLTSLHQIDLETVWFPGATGSGLDFGFELGWEFLPFLGVVAGFDVIRYGFDFNDMPTETKSGAPAEAATPADPLKAPMLAGGATDTYITGRLGVQVTLGGAKPAK
jgi:hypothetical protein